MTKDLEYLSGLNNEFSSEAVAGSLPVRHNNPQQVPHGLFAEQLSGSAFTAYPDENLRTWLYRINPPAKHAPLQKSAVCSGWLSSPSVSDFAIDPVRLRWGPQLPIKKTTDFIESFFTVAANGSVAERQGSAIHLYHANASMQRAMCNMDAEILVVPQAGTLNIQTELGFLEVAPAEIAVIPRGMKFRVTLADKTASGYVCENYGAPFRLPYRGPIGANGLASRRHFLSPIAAYEDKASECELIAKFQGSFWQTTLPASPFDVVAWSGNYVPYKYDLDNFNTIGTVSFDHPDPSLFTVLTSPTHQPGVANVDFVIFPPRWMVAEETFRPPYFHRNIMSEYMGLIKGVYDAKPSADGFVPGGGSLHNCMSSHGPEAESYEHAVKADLKPQKIDKSLAFMLESFWVYAPSKQALESSTRQKNYADCWQGLQPSFQL